MIHADIAAQVVIISVRVLTLWQHSQIIKVLLNFLINKVGPTMVWIVTTIVVSLALVFTIYPIGILLTTRLNPIPFVKKTMKIGLFAAATNSSAATLPLNTKTCVEELGCSEEISSFVLPTGMTINMNGTTAMHMIAITFIATAAGIDIKPSTLVLAMNYLPGMAVITLNVIGDSATNVIVNFKEGVLNKEKYNSRV